MLEDALKELMEEVKELLDERKESLRIMGEATYTIKMLKEAVPKIVCSLGASLCKVAESIVPSDRVIVIKFHQPTKKYQLNIINNNSTSFEELKQDLYNALRLAEDMKDEDGILYSTYSDLEN